MNAHSLSQLSQNFSQRGLSTQAGSPQFAAIEQSTVADLIVIVLETEVVVLAKLPFFARRLLNVKVAEPSAFAFAFKVTKSFPDPKTSVAVLVSPYLYPEPIKAL